ncbi:MAG: DMT family transporter [Acidobacteria bacterium]|nr:DMT family transporter [Acidobacteriota bacterium]
MKSRAGVDETPPTLPPSPSIHLWEAYLAMVAATLFWSTNAIAVKLMLREIPVVTAAMLRVAVAAGLLAALYAWRGGRFRLRPGELWIFLKLGLWGLSLSFFFFTTGLYYTSVAHAVFIGALVPMAVLLLARLARQERITTLKLAGILLSLGGVLLLALEQAGGAEASWKGDLLIGGGVWCFAFYTVRAKNVAAHYPSLQFNTYIFLAGAAWFLPFLLPALWRLDWSAIGGAAWSSFFYSASVGSAGAYLAYYFALRRLAASRVAVFHYVQPLLASSLGVVLLHETWGLQVGLGALLILLGVFLAEYR